MAITQNQPINGVPTTSGTTSIKVIPTTDVASSVKTGTSIIVPNPVDSIQKATPTVVATTPTTPTTPTPVYATNADMTSARPIIIAIPSVISDTVKRVTGSPILGGGGGGGGSASSEEVEESGNIEEPKKPNYLLLALLGVGAYFLFKKFK